MRPFDSINLLGVTIHLATVELVLQYIDESLTVGRKTVIPNANVKALNLAYEQTWYRNFLNNTSLVYCDGMGVRLAARMMNYHAIPERFTLADWIWKLAEHASGRGYSMFLLGNPPGSASRAAIRLCKSYPSLKIVGVQHGYFDLLHNSEGSQCVINEIRAASPDILMVGFGMPLQEKWIVDHWNAITAKVVLPCGALFEYITGELKRGPHWMTDNYLEWLARIIISPRRYSKRYLVDNTKFLWRVLKQRFTKVAKANQ